jgi:hypothetical protein
LEKELDGATAETELLSQALTDLQGELIDLESLGAMFSTRA